MPVTYWTFLVGTLAIAGIVPFSGFYSKDAILARALEQNSYGRFVLGVVVAILTAFYMFRLFFVVFRTTARSETASHAHESPPVMVVPLRILAVFSLIGGFIGVENVYGRQVFMPGVEPGHSLSFAGQLVAPFTHAPFVAIFGLFAAILGFGLAYVLYAKASKDPLPQKIGVLSRWMRDRFYFDELYQATVIRLHDWAAIVADWIDRWLIGFAAVRGAHATTELLGRMVRQLQTGNLQTYAFLFALGVAFLLYVILQ
jgi:NADH-quinone oxidoreductase subunit L